MNRLRYGNITDEVHDVHDQQFGIRQQEVISRAQGEPLYLETFEFPTAWLHDSVSA